MIARRIVTAAKISPAVLPSDHAVQFYESDRSLIELLAQELAAALKAGDTVIMNATRKHRNALRAELALRNVDLPAAMRSGCFPQKNREIPAECLANFMVNGTDKDRFESVMGALYGDAEAVLKPWASTGAVWRDGGAALG